MISAVALARSYRARLALDVLKDSRPSSENSTSSSPVSRMLGSLGFDDSGSTRLDSKTLATLLQAIQNQNGGTPAVDKPSQAVAGFLGTKNFMTMLKDKLSDGGDNPLDYVNYQSMLAALQDGTLSVTNPATGETATAFEPKDDKQNATIADGEKTAWNTFLDSHLKRNGDGSFAKSADGSYIDTRTGENAYFGKVGGTYYYFTWPGKMSAEV